MARYRYGRDYEEVWEYYFWPLGIGTPYWFDNNHAQYRDWNSPIERLWSLMRRARLIRLRRVV
ncbi:hypothetical protein [Saccharomonospora viridis]|uniref:hypothetical protein n=1 Tax=Saccharomonospora viridis TaxID=1852 RepID=UPI002409E367|nr:hypothetical protein [Saccharomonospora viridis]